MRAELSLTSASLARLLRHSGSQSTFILSSIDGRTVVRVGLAIASVPDAEVALGSSGVVLDWSGSTIARAGNQVRLSRMEMRLLAALLHRGPEPASREELARQLWPAVSRRYADNQAALVVMVCALRKRFSAIGLSGAVKTVRGIGYSLQL